MPKRSKFLGALLGLSLSLAGPGLQAAEQIVLVSGAFRRSIPVADLTHLAETGQARGLLADLLSLSRQDPAEVSKLLNQSVSLPLVLTSRLLSTRIGDVLLKRLARIISPLSAPQTGVPALRAAVILGLNAGNGTITPVGFLQAYPVNEMAISLPALVALADKASSIADLVRFFSESPLDGLREEAEPPAQPKAP